MKGVDSMDKRAITDRLDYAIRLIQYVRDNVNYPHLAPLVFEVGAYKSSS